MSIVAQVAAGCLTVKAAEYLVHRYVLHGRGLKKDSFWSAHFHIHHKAARKYGMLDPDYEEFPLFNQSGRREVGGLAFFVSLFLPTVVKFPYYFGTVALGAGHYFFKHRKSHMDEEYAWKYMQNHVKHHLINQNNYWEVSGDLTDLIAGTAPSVDPEEWEKKKSFYMKRARDTRPIIEREMAQRKAQRRQRVSEIVGNVQGRLDELTQKLYGNWLIKTS